MKILSYKDYQILEQQTRMETLDALNEADICNFTHEEIDALVLLQVISIDEEVVSVHEGLFDYIKNPIAATKLTNNAKKLAQVLTTKYKVEDEFDDKIAEADPSKKDALKKLKTSKISILGDKESAINDRMDTLSSSSAGLGKMATLLKLRAKIKAAEAGIQDKDERAEKLSNLKQRETASVQSLQQIGKEAKAKEAETQKEEKAKPAQTSAEPKQPAKVESLEDQYTRLKSERQQDESALASMKEKLTGRSVSGQNGILEKIAAKQAQLKDAKLGEQKKAQIRKEIDALKEEADKLKAEIADFEEGVKETRKLEAETYDKLQAAKKDAE